MAQPSPPASPTPPPPSRLVSRYRAYRLPAFVLAATLLAAVGVATVAGLRSFANSAEWVEHSYQVIAEIESTLAATRTVESSARGYRLTDRPSLHAEYLTSIPAALSHSSALIALTRDNPRQNRLARDVERRVRQRLAEIDRLLEMHMRDPQQARLSSQTSHGAEQMRALTAVADAMREYERALLSARDARTERNATLLTALVIGGLLLALGLLALLMLNLWQENKRSRALERESRQALAELEASAAERQRLTERHRSLSHYAGLLQSCQTLQEAMDMTAHAIADLIPEFGGRCYILRASQNLAETAARFGREAIASADLLHPDDCWALRRGRIHRSQAHDGGVRCAHLARAEAGADSGGDPRWSLCVPLMAQNTSLGLLCLSGERPPREADLALIQSIAEQLSLAVVNLQLRETLRVQSLRDPLTGLFNRRYLEENLQRELLRCQRRKLPLSVLMLDVDHFKRFNDTHGHAAGDALLARVGQLLQELVRNEDIACRYGGEEFTVVLPEADAATAMQRAEQIRAAIAATTIVHLRQTFGPATCSIGLATSVGDRETPQQLLQAADAALYRAKAEGRDRVVDGNKPAAADA
ncbi:sensor domain-containing diguanylate cyclase [Lysobacter enzymogenes]|uniref:diguanylate cyclase n=1 Tax=Lysobacter enzymogenes TaxID=69 RepID=A0A2D3I2V9_LYSEN|nr:diguanylate cyclase [Lysobacter enzymogenes]ATU81885.1 GGDEF domain-containing protein [Lysobacter enzymogenes]ROU07045.1 diguanylate cyclase [Lysobacter enzymogenes]